MYYTGEKEHLEIWSYRKGLKCYSKQYKVTQLGTSKSSCLILWIFQLEKKKKEKKKKTQMYQLLINKPLMQEKKKKDTCSLAASRKKFPQKQRNVYVMYKILLCLWPQCFTLVTSIVGRWAHIEKETFFSMVSYYLRKAKALG